MTRYSFSNTGITGVDIVFIEQAVDLQLLLLLTINRHDKIIIVIMSESGGKKKEMSSKCVHFWIFDRTYIFMNYLYIYSN